MGENRIRKVWCFTRVYYWKMVCKSPSDPNPFKGNNKNQHFPKWRRGNISYHSATLTLSNWRFPYLGCFLVVGLFANFTFLCHCCPASQWHVTNYKPPSLTSHCPDCPGDASGPLTSLCPPSGQPILVSFPKLQDTLTKTIPQSLQLDDLSALARQVSFFMYSYAYSSTPKAGNTSFPVPTHKGSSTDLVPVIPERRVIRKQREEQPRWRGGDQEHFPGHANIWAEAWRLRMELVGYIPDIST